MMGAKSDINWDAQPLGEVSDVVLARRLGVTPGPVGIQRRKRGIDPFEYRVPDEHKMVDDEEIAAYIAAVGLRLRSIREEHGITQAQLGKRAGIAIDQVSRLEHGHYVSPGLRTILRIAMAMRIDVVELLAEPSPRRASVSPGFLLRVDAQVEKLATLVRSERERSDG